jgi:putative component of membrane protein insertase Oxa1/YidC/SpoIIIJ protein YidD
MTDTPMKCVYLSVLCFLLAGPALAGSPATQPEVPSVMAGSVRFFQNYLSGADGHRCPMTPSCSSYALQAMQRHGAIKGWIMACDRLMRCGRDEVKNSPSVMTRDGLRCQDPLVNNDFWLH